jgi:hypothetical protein
VLAVSTNGCFSASTTLALSKHATVCTCLSQIILYERIYVVATFQSCIREALGLNFDWDMTILAVSFRHFSQSTQSKAETVP